MTKITIRHLPLIIGALLLLPGCGSQDEDWIEVPLADNTYFAGEGSYREQDFDVLVLNQSAREFKLALKEDNAIAYRWTVQMDDPELLTVEFHGHTERVGDEPGTVMFYTKHNQTSEQGALVAPFDGIHGWYLKNDSDQDITIKLRVAGFFKEVDD
ncbi:MAG: hypothetical protein WDZ30_03925 [Cellvibrionaceae bacterium]